MGFCFVDFQNVYGLCKISFLYREHIQTFRQEGLAPCTNTPGSLSARVSTHVFASDAARQWLKQTATREETIENE